MTKAGVAATDLASSYRASTNRVTRNYDVAPDGQRFLMIEDLEPEPMPDLTIVMNWYEELGSHFPEE